MPSLEYAVLASLAPGPLSGQALQQRVQGRVGHRLSYGTLSRVLTKLEAEQALVIDGQEQARRLGNRDFVTYELTTLGRKRLGDQGPAG